MNRKIYYRHDRETNEIIFSFSPGKIRNGIRVYFYRDINEQETNDYPVAMADQNGTNIYEWICDFKILTIHIKRPIFFGLLGYKWEVATDINLI